MVYNQSPRSETRKRTELCRYRPFTSIGTHGDRPVFRCWLHQRSRGVIPHDKSVIGIADAVLEADLRCPAHGAELVCAHQFARRAVGLGEVVDDVALKADHLADQLRQVEDRDIRAGADIDVFLAGIILQQEKKSIQKFKIKVKKLILNLMNFKKKLIMKKKL